MGIRITGRLDIKAPSLSSLSFEDSFLPYLLPPIPIHPKNQEIHNQSKTRNFWMENGENDGYGT